MKQETETEILGNIEKAHTVSGAPASSYRTLVNNFAEWEEELVKKYGANPAMVYLSQDIASPRLAFTYQEFIKKANRIANFLYLKLGLRRGERLAVLMNNHPDMLAVYLAVLKMGGIVCPLTPQDDEKKKSYILQNAAVKIAVGQDDFIPQLLSLKSQVPSLKHIVKVGEMKDEETLFFRDLVTSSSPIFSPKDMTSLDDEAIMIYTSGTTGLPKGVILSQYNLLVNAENIARHLGLNGTTRTLGLMSLTHVNEVVTTFLATFSAGGCLVIPEKPKTAQTGVAYWQIISSEKITSLNLTPSLLQDVLEQYKTAAADKSFKPKYFICGEGALSSDLVTQVEETTGIKTIQGYGLTETSGYIAMLPVNLSPKEHNQWMMFSEPVQDGGSKQDITRRPSIGIPLSYTEINILDEQGQELPPGKKGEVVIRGHSLTKGYYKRPEANIEAFKYGWFHTGDEGFYFADKNKVKMFFISGRLKDIINRAGMKIAPQEIERVLYEVPGVKWGLVVGFSNKWTSEEVGVFVVPEKEETLSSQTVIDYIRGKLGFYKTPKVVVFGNEIPKESSNYVLRQQFATHFQNWKETKFEEIT